MKKKQLAYWQAYVDAIKTPMRLQNWRITVMPYDPEMVSEDAGAGIRACDNNLDADLILGKEWVSFSDDLRREYLTHELVHLHLWHYMKHTEAMANRFGEEARGFAHDTNKHLLETTTDEIARTIAPFLPLPPRAKEKAA